MASNEVDLASTTDDEAVTEVVDMPIPCFTYQEDDMETEISAVESSPAVTPPCPSSVSVSANLMTLELPVILPQEIPDCVLEAADTMNRMLEKTVEIKVNLYIKDGQRKKFQLLDLTLPKSYATKLKNDSSLMESIVGKICYKVESVEHLILPELAIETMDKLVCEKKILRGITECKRVDVPFSASQNAVLRNRAQLENHLIQVAKVLVEIFAPEPHHCINIDFKPADQGSETPLIEIKKTGAGSSQLKKKMKDTISRVSTGNIEISCNRATIIKLGEKQKLNDKKAGQKRQANSRKRQTLMAQPGDTPDTRSLAPKKSKANSQLTAKKLAKPKPIPKTCAKFTFDSFQASSQETISAQPAADSRWFTAYNYWQLEKIHGRDIKGRNTVMAVVDSGIDPAHLTFRENGKIIDFQDFSGDKMHIDPNASMDHGTLCAGIACGTEFTCYESTLSFPAGVAPDAKLVICKVLKAANNGEAMTSSISDALKWILEFNKSPKDSSPALPATTSNNRIDVVSLSLGSLQFPPEIAEAVTNLVNNNVIVVCAASNNGQKYSQPISWPARLGNVLCIGSHGPHGKPSPFSPVGQEIDFLAPGENIIGPSSIPYSSYLITDSGTSYAAPAVAGLVCLILGYIKEIYSAEDAKYFQKHWVMKEILRGISTSPGRHSDDQGFGALNPRQFFQHPTPGHVLLDHIVSVLHDE